MRTLLRFAGFHRQLSFGLLRGLLYLQACKLRSASGILLEKTTSESRYIFLLFSFALFVEGQKIFFVSCVVGFYRSLSQNNTAHASQAFAKVQHVRLCRVLSGFCCNAGIACEQWCSYIVRHRAPLCVLLTRVWKPGFIVK